MKAISQSKSDSIVADWRTGAYSQQKLADKHRVGKATVNKLCKGVEQDATELVTAGVRYQCGVAAQSDRLALSIREVVDDRTRHTLFFADATEKNISMMMDKLNETHTIMEHRIAQAAIKDGKETVLGKSPDTAIQFNSNGGSDSELPAIDVIFRDARGEII